MQRVEESQPRACISLTTPQEGAAQSRVSFIHLTVVLTGTVMRAFSSIRLLNALVSRSRDVRYLHAVTPINPR